MSKQEVIKELDKDIPRSAISERDGGSGKKLSYLAGYYVIDRLNKVVGIGNWAYTSDAQLVDSRSVEKEDKYTAGKINTTHHAHYLAKVRLVVHLPDSEATEFTDYGYGDGSDKLLPGKAHELAVKEAVTDGIKRCAKNLGMSMGLALYDKEQVNVSEEEAPKADAKPPNRDKINELITMNSRVIIDKKLATADEIRAEMNQLYGTSKKEDLTDSQASEFLTKMRNKLNVRN
jgi:recombination DNA repair RAD52 pathway protein